MAPSRSQKYYTHYAFPYTFRCANCLHCTYRYANRVLRSTRAVIHGLNHRAYFLAIAVSYFSIIFNFHRNDEFSSGKRQRCIESRTYRESVLPLFLLSCFFPTIHCEVMSLRWCLKDGVLPSIAVPSAQ